MAPSDRTRVGRAADRREPPGRIDRTLAVLRLDGTALHGGQGLVRIAGPETL